MEVVSWGRLTAELGVAYARVVCWNDAPALAAAARSAVSEQAAQDAEHYSSDDDFADGEDGGTEQRLSSLHPRAAAALRRAPVLWRRHGVDVRAVLNVDDLSPLEDEVVAAARSGFVASDLVVGNITNPTHPVRAVLGPDGLACGLFLSPHAPTWRALPRVLGVYSGAVRSRVEFDDAVAADPNNPDVQAYSFDLDFANAECWPLHPLTRECDSVLVDARVHRNEMAFVNDARGSVSRLCPLAAGVSAEMALCDAERVSVRFVDVAVGGLPYVVMVQVAHVAPGEELLCDYSLQYWVNIRRAYATRRAVQQLLHPGLHQQDFTAALPPDRSAPPPHRPRTLSAAGGADDASQDSSFARRASKQRAGMSAAAQASPAMSGGGAKLDELRVALLQLDGTMPPVPRALSLPFGVSFDVFFERHIRKWRLELLEAPDDVQLIRLANKLAGWMSPYVLRADWNLRLNEASAEQVVAALQAGVIKQSVDALWAEAEQAAAASGQALYALEEDANWHEVLSTQVARTRSATARERGLSILQLRNGADWRDAVLGALNITGPGAPPPRIARLLLRAIRRRFAGGGLLDLNNARESRDEVERILALPQTTGSAGGSREAPHAEPQRPAAKLDAAKEEPPPCHRKRRRERRHVPTSEHADDDPTPPIASAAAAPALLSPRQLVQLAAPDSMGKITSEQQPPQQQPSPPPPDKPADVIDLTGEDD